MSFESLGLHALLQKTVDNLEYKQATPVQNQAIPSILNGHDVVAGAQTGTGKTAAFVLPILHRLLNADAESMGELNKVPDVPKIKALILTPTRELAQQVYKSCITYSKETNIRSVVAYGGASINTQIAELKEGADILVATPGRLLELTFKKLVDLREISVLVFDEADRMLDMGFMAEVSRILKRLPEKKQTLLFSATFNDEVYALSKSLMSSPVYIEVGERNQAATKVDQVVYAIDSGRKRAFVSYLIGSKNWQQVLVFTRTKQGADDLAKEMNKDGLEAQSIHGDKSQGARDRVLSDFKAGRLRALVATDVAARGLDIPSLEQVINFELPYNAEDYIHRIGRTGRAGKAGLAISLVSAKEQYLLKDVEEQMGETIVQQWYPGFEPDLNADEVSSKKHRSGNSKKRARDKAIQSSKRKSRK
ncbi:DEAD/DEAH box helicase [Marinomonas algicola]|uniref:DEAD/DEAH box helicase n=1 Tax=Marinomonas algicola TaxID=2773454 RepID=UPI001749E0C4|nr:DEAD/DEAH box helicase [Marinomonas algicola]